MICSKLRCLSRIVNYGFACSIPPFGSFFRDSGSGLNPEGFLGDLRSRCVCTYKTNKSAHSISFFEGCTSSKVK